jgi:hypothetical protein
MEPLTVSERLQVLRDRYYLTLGPLVLLIAVGHATSPALFWVATTMFIALTINKVVPLLR